MFTMHHAMPNRLRLLPVLALLAAGCGTGDALDGGPAAAPAVARYQVRADLMAVGNLGAPPKWYTAGYPPLRSLRLAPNTPDPEFVKSLGPLLGKDILDPLAAPLSEAQRDDVGQYLDRAFGTPARPTVRVPTKDELAAVKVDEMFTERLPKGKTPKGAMEDARAAAEAARSHLGLTDESLVRGSVVYRRWCVECHGISGGGDGVHAVPAGPMPRDYRQGVFKFVTASPTGTTAGPGERGNPRTEDLRRTVRNGLDGSMMPPFPNIPDRDLDDLLAYVVHLSVRGETEFEVLRRAIKPREDDPEFTGKELAALFAYNLLTVLGNWRKAAESPIPVPPENCPTEADRVASAVRGFAAFREAGCAGCHVNYGREMQLKFDVWGTVVQPRNLVLGVYRGGRRGEDLYARLYGGIFPSGMNEHKQLLATKPAAAGKPDYLWDIVHFLQALADPYLRHRMQMKDPSVKIEP